MEEKELLKMANEFGYDSINKIKNWNNYEVYEMYTEGAKLGMFTALLVKNNKVRVSKYEEAFEILNVQ